jgi:hypothetical protein
MITLILALIMLKPQQPTPLTQPVRAPMAVADPEAQPPALVPLAGSVAATVTPLISKRSRDVWQADKSHTVPVRVDICNNIRTVVDMDSGLIRQALSPYLILVGLDEALFRTNKTTALRIQQTMLRGRIELTPGRCSEDEWMLFTSAEVPELRPMTVILSVSIENGRAVQIGNPVVVQGNRVAVPWMAEPWAPGETLEERVKMLRKSQKRK